MVVTANESFADDLRRAIEEKGLTLSDVARLLGIHRATVSAWVTGKSVPKRDTMDKLNVILGNGGNPMNITRRSDELAELESEVKFAEDSELKQAEKIIREEVMLLKLETRIAERMEQAGLDSSKLDLRKMVMDIWTASVHGD